ncbi:hypothetical protein ACNKHW_21260 [Shigella flexneri]
MTLSVASLMGTALHLPAEVVLDLMTVIAGDTKWLWRNPSEGW